MPDQQHIPPESPLVSVQEAAPRLGISERAVRKRIAAGKLAGVMIDRAWYVRLPEPAEPAEQGREPGADRNYTGAGTEAASPAPVAATPAEQVIQAVLAPFIRELGEVREDLGRERERRERAERERDALQARVEALTYTSTPRGDNPLLPAPPEPSQDAQSPRPWWRRLFGG